MFLSLKDIFVCICFVMAIDNVKSSWLRWQSKSKDNQTFIDLIGYQSSKGSIGMPFDIQLGSREVGKHWPGKCWHQDLSNWSFNRKCNRNLLKSLSWDVGTSISWAIVASISGEIGTSIFIWNVCWLVLYWRKGQWPAWKGLVSLLIFILPRFQNALSPF